MAVRLPIVLLLTALVFITVSKGNILYLLIKVEGSQETENLIEMNMMIEARTGVICLMIKKLEYNICAGEILGDQN